MPAIEPFVLEPFGDSDDVWIALRTDGNNDRLMLERPCLRPSARSNVISLNATQPIHFDWSGVVGCLNNLTPQGAILRAFDLGLGRFTEVYIPAAEDALFAMI